MIRRHAPASSPAARSVSVGPALRNHVRCSDLVLRLRHTIHSVVMAGLVPAIHEWREGLGFSWIPGTRPGMTIELMLNHLNESKH
jgi:hypothetical protein